MEWEEVEEVALQGLRSQPPQQQQLLPLSQTSPDPARQTWSRWAAGWWTSPGAGLEPRPAPPRRVPHPAFWVSLPLQPNAVTVVPGSSFMEEHAPKTYGSTTAPGPSPRTATRVAEDRRSWSIPPLRGTARANLERRALPSPLVLPLALPRGLRQAECLRREGSSPPLARVGRATRKKKNSATRTSFISKSRFLEKPGRGPCLPEPLPVPEHRQGTHAALLLPILSRSLRPRSSASSTWLG